MDNNKRKGILKFFVSILILSILWVIFYYSTKSGIGMIIDDKPAMIGLLISIFFASVLFSVFTLIRYNRLLKELKQTERFVNDINDENYCSDSMINAAIPVVKSINNAIRDVAESKKNQLSELCQRTKQLDEMNTELNDAYMQLESSYGQLEAVIEQLNESEKRYHSLVVNIPDIVLTPRMQGYFKIQAS